MKASYIISYNNYLCRLLDTGQLVKLFSGILAFFIFSQLHIVKYCMLAC